MTCDRHLERGRISDLHSIFFPLTTKTEGKTLKVCKQSNGSISRSSMFCKQNIENLNVYSWIKCFILETDAFLLLFTATYRKLIEPTSCCKLERLLWILSCQYGLFYLIEHDHTITYLFLTRTGPMIHGHPIRSRRIVETACMLKLLCVLYGSENTSNWNQFIERARGLT